MKLIKHKKGFNDITIITGIFLLLFLTASGIVFANNAFSQNYDQYDTDGNIQDIKDDVDSTSSISAFSVLITALKLSLWDVGDTLSLPWWLDLFYTLVTITLILTVSRNIWVGGGG